MATRSTISILNTDGSVEGVYCHWDGYPSHNGKLLKECYDTETKVRNLITMGDLSSLDYTLSECKFYHRDREEDFEDVKPRKADNLFDFRLGEEFNYVFDVSKGEWFLKTVSNKLKPFDPDSTEYQY